MAIDTIRVRPESHTDDPVGGVMDVSGVPAVRVQSLVPAASGRDVYLERRDGKTYLVTAD